MKISKELVQEILNYLSTRPYGEVYRLISKLLTLQPEEVKVEKPSKQTKDGSSR